MPFIDFLYLQATKKNVIKKILIICLIICCTSCAVKPVYRNVHWNMTMEEIIAFETAEVDEMIKSPNGKRYTLYYQVNVFEEKAQLQYNFHNGKLTDMGVFFGTMPQRICDTLFNVVYESLIQKHGDQEVKFSEEQFTAGKDITEVIHNYVWSEKKESLGLTYYTYTDGTCKIGFSYSRKISLQELEEE